MRQTLLSILYDDLLTTLLLESINTIACADDLALVIAARDTKGLMRTGSEVLDQIEIWMNKKEWELAAQKKRNALF